MSVKKQTDDLTIDIAEYIVHVQKIDRIITSYCAGCVSKRFLSTQSLSHHK